MTYEHISWRGGTKQPRNFQNRGNRDQSDEPPAEYWEQKEAEITGEADHEDDK